LILPPPLLILARKIVSFLIVGVARETKDEKRGGLNSAWCYITPSQSLEFYFNMQKRNQKIRRSPGSKGGYYGNYN
jgi:hypothetical protein